MNFIQSCLIALIIFVTVPADSAENNDLFSQIKNADEKFFTAFNSCDIKTMSAMFSTELEFYHDIAGLSDYTSNIEATKSLCSRNLGLVRTLIPESLEVYPVKDFGAIQIGQHRFCHKANGKDDCGTFGFTHIWKSTEQGWLIHRVASYGH